MDRLTFPDLLTAFAAAVEANDGEGLASLFTEDGTYEDGFFGAHTGRPAIAVMLQRFHDTGRAYLWEFLDPLSDGSIGYARFRFSYAFLLPEAAGRPVFFEGQLDFPAERIKHILARAATVQNRNPETKRHLDRFSAG